MTQARVAAACELMRKGSRGCVLLACLLMGSSVAAQQAGDAHAAAQPVGQAEPAHGAAAEHAGGGYGTIAPVVNFLILCGVLYYLLKTPLATYLAGRGATIRKDLVDAAALKASASAQLAQIDARLKALPAEIEALRTRGAEEIRSEEQRIAQAAVAERERLLEQTRREIEVQLRVARQDITEHAADLSVQLASERIRNEITPIDQLRLVDRYLEQVKR